MKRSKPDITLQLEDILSATLIKAKDIYTTTEATIFLGVKRSYLYELIRKHHIPFYRSRGGKLIYFKRSDLEKWMPYTKVPSDLE